MRVLLTNDDGIRAEGLRAMYRALREAGHTVHVVAPMHEQSGVGHSLTFFDPLRAHKIEEPDFEGLGLYGTPTDCVKLALGNLLKKRPDMVISGINAGSNVGPDILYSGTVGAAMEALLNGVPAIAFSETHVGCREVTDMFLYEIARELIQRPLAGEIWNVNFPDCTLNEYKGILRDVKIEPHCFFENFYNTAENENGCALSPYAELLDPERAENGSDLWAVLHGYIAIGRVKNMLLG